MSFTASGPVLMLVLLYFFIARPKSLAYVLVFFAPFSATAIINFGGLAYKSGGLGLTPAMFSFLLFLVAQIGLGLAFRRLIVGGGLLILTLLIAVFGVLVTLSLATTAIYEPVTSYKITQSIYMTIGVLMTISLAFEISRPGGIEKFVTVLRASAIFVSIWGLIQFACYTAHIPYPDFLFNNSKSDAADAFDQTASGIVRIASVAIEPSFFASSLLHFVSFGFTLLVVERRLRTLYWIFPVGLGAALLVLSTSSTAYFGLVVLGGLLFMRNPRTSMVVGGPVLVVAAAVLLLVPKAARILAIMTIEKGETGSYVERTTGAIQAMRAFVENPFFGSGWGTVIPYNAITATLANSGLIGTVIFFAAGVGTLIELRSTRAVMRDDTQWKMVAYAKGAQNTLIVALAVSISSGIHFVVADDWCFWGFAIALGSQMRLSIGGRAENQGSMPAVSIRRPISASAALGGGNNLKAETGRVLPARRVSY